LAVSAGRALTASEMLQLACGGHGRANRCSAGGTNPRHRGADFSHFHGGGAKMVWHLGRVVGHPARPLVR
jgi:hypothetical protein